MRRLLSVVSLVALTACATPDHNLTYPRGFPGLRGVMNHLPDGRWQFVLELPNPHRRTVYRVESLEPLDIKVEQDAPWSRAVWIVDAGRVDGIKPFQLKLWADGDDFPIQVGFPKDGRDYRHEATASLIFLSLAPRR